MAPRTATPRHFLSIQDLASDLGRLIEHAARLKAQRRRARLRPSLSGRNIALIFEKPSTRTRTSFEGGIHDLRGDAIYYSPKEMQLGRGETIGDTARVLSRYVDAIVYRAFRHDSVLELARSATVPVINALDDREHPTQIVADLLTLSERWKGSFKGRRLAWIGDGNNVLHSLMLGAALVGLDLVCATPENYRPLPEIVTLAREYGQPRGAGLTFTDDPAAAAEGADALYTDVWVSMGDEAETAKREKAFRGFQINAELLARAKPTAFVLHDLPAHRGQEITDEVLDGARSAAWDEAENRLHAEKAILELLLAPERLPRPSAARPWAPKLTARRSTRR
ncbi:MAG: ornithine carbamoyltransferase [Thermoplasmata archaeon]